MKNSIKIILLLIFFNFMESVISIPLSKIYIIFPLTFLFYSYYIYKSKENKSPIEAFLLGLLIDLISGSYFGLNAILFCIITYLINLYANSFKLFSYLQICIFFGVSATLYVGFTQLIINLYNFSYLILFISAIFNIILCIVIAAISVYFGSYINLKK